MSENARKEDFWSFRSVTPEERDALGVWVKKHPRLAGFVSAEASVNLLPTRLLAYLLSDDFSSDDVTAPVVREMVVIEEIGNSFLKESSDVAFKKKYLHSKVGGSVVAVLLWAGGLKEIIQRLTQ